MEGDVTTSQPDVRLGPYRLLHELGEGAFSRVYLAEHPADEQRVILKTARTWSPEVELAFRSEYLLGSRLRHPHLGAVLDHGYTGPHRPYVVVAYHHGETLSALKGPQSAETVLRLGAMLARGLAALHAEGLVHRDVTPSNVVFEASGNIRLIDFGLVAMAGATAGAGTPLYMAPEAIAGAPVDARADLYALGALLYRLATGAAPFEDRAPEALLEAATRTLPPPVGPLAPQLPQAAASLIMRLLAKEAGDRPDSAQAVAQALERLADPPLTVALAAGRWQETEAWRAWEPEAGEPGAWSFVGEGGSGRSRHLEEAFAHLRRGDVPAVLVAGGEHDGPYGLVERLWRWGEAHAPGHGDALAPAERAAVAAVWPHRAPGATPEREPARLASGLRQALAGLLTAVAGADAVAVLIDDWEAVDAASRAILAPMLAGSQAPIHWLLGARAPVAGATALPLGAWDPETAREWLPTCAPGLVTPDLAGRLHAAGGGNPGWMHAALAHLQRAGTLTGAIAIPETIHAMLEAQWGRLSLDQRALAEVLALWAAPVTAAELAEWGPLLPGSWQLELSNLVARGLLSLKGGTYAFDRAWWPAWIADRLSAARRSALALQLAQAVEPAEGPEAVEGPLPHRLARLYALACDPAGTVRWGLAAGHASARVFANEEALAHFEAIARVLDGHPEAWRYKFQRLEARVAAADVQRLTGALTEAAARYAECLEEVQMPLERSRLWVSLGKTRQMLNQLALARDAYSEALALLTPGTGDRERLRALAALGRVAHHLGDRAGSIEAYGEALALARAVGDATHEAEALSFLGTLMVESPATSAEGLEHLRAALAVREGLDDAVGSNDTHMLLGNALLTLGRYGEALVHFEANWGLARAIGHHQEQAFAALNIAMCELERGHWAAALTMIEEGRVLAAKVEDAFLLGLFAFVESLARLHLGDGAAVEGCLGEARERESALGSPYLRLYGLIYEAERHLFLGGFEAARRASELAVAIVEKGTGGECAVKARLLLAEAWLHLGQLDKAEAQLAIAKDGFSHAHGGPRVQIGWLAGALAAARQDPASASAEWQAALAEARRQGLTRWEVRLILALHGLARQSVSVILAPADVERAYALAEAQRDPEALALCCLALAVAHLGAQRDLLAERLSRRGQELLAHLTQAMPSTGARAAFLAHPERAPFTEIQELTEAHRLLRQTRRLEMLLELGCTIGATREPDGVLEKVRAFTLEVTQAERCLILLNPGRGLLKLHGGEEAPYSRTIVERVRESGEPVCVLDTRADDGLKTQSSILDMQVRSVMCVPMAVGGTLHGLLYVDSQLGLGAFTPEDLRVLVAIAGQAAVALDNARLHKALMGQLREREAHIRRLEESEGVIRHLEELDRLRGEYFQAASHDLRSPLASVNASCQALLKGVMGPLSPDQADTVSGIHHSARSLTGMIDAVLDAAQLDAGKLLLHPQPVPIARPVAEAVKLLLALAADKGLELRWDAAALAALPPVRGDERRLQAVLLNLIGNAIKFTTQGHVAVAAVAEGDRVLLTVSDTGPGLPPEREADPFQRYGARGESRAPGSGLGLWLVKGLVELHEGTLHVRTRPGAGCVFTIGLPLA